VEVSVLHGLKKGNEVLKEIHREMSLESVERLMEETHEAREYQRVGRMYYFHDLSLDFHITQEIGNLLANQLTLEEEDAVQAELLELEAANVCFVVLLSSLRYLKVSVGAPNPTNVTVGTEGATCCS
jgi:charged multivesicular body protein 6